MAAFMRTFEACRKGCWVEKKLKWTNSGVQEMINTIRKDFINMYLKNINIQAKAFWSTVYVRMSIMGKFLIDNQGQ